MDNLILKTIIFILKDKETKKPVVVTHFQGFENDDEAAVALEEAVNDEKQVCRHKAIFDSHVSINAAGQLGARQ